MSLNLVALWPSAGKLVEAEALFIELLSAYEASGRLGHAAGDPCADALGAMTNYAAVLKDLGELV